MLAPRASVSPEHALSLLGELPYGIAIFQAESRDPLDLRLVYANAEASQQLGLDLDTLCGRTVRDAFPAGLGDGAHRGGESRSGRRGRCRSVTGRKWPGGCPRDPRFAWRKASSASPVGL